MVIMILERSSHSGCPLPVRHPSLQQKKKKLFVRLGAILVFLFIAFMGVSELECSVKLRPSLFFIHPVVRSSNSDTVFSLSQP